MDIQICGLVGWNFKKGFELSIERRVALAAVLSTGADSRGGDSCGWYVPEKGTKRVIGDLARHVTKFYSANIMMGHTRKATSGAITVPNCHPFEVGNILLSHNGIISDYHTLNKLYERNCEVDSMHLAHHLAEGRDFSDISGYGTVEFVRMDEDPSKIYLVKMQAGDLHVWGIGKDEKNCKGVIWSSDDDHIRSALVAANLEGFPYEVDQGEVCYVKDGRYFSTDAKLELASNYSNYHVWKNEYGWMMPDGDDTDKADRMAFKEQMDQLSTDEQETFKQLWGIDDDETEGGSDAGPSGQVSDKELQQLYDEQAEREFAKELSQELADNEGEQIWIGDKFVDKRTLSKDDVKIIKKYTETVGEPVSALFMRKDVA